MFADADNPDVWWLGHATKYASDSGRATFGGPPAPKSNHAFWWNRKDHTFVLANNYGMDRTHDATSFPREAAEAFLIRCTDPEFNAQFLNQVYTSKAASEVIETKIGIGQGKVLITRRRDNFPDLSVSFLGTNSPNGAFSLFSDLRQDFGRRLLKLSPEEVRAKLRAP